MVLSPEISVLIVSWNVKEYLPKCLDSLVSETERISYEVVVVDNQSRDETIEIIEGQYPWVKLIRNCKNVGFSAANNQAALNASAEALLILNPDTILKKNAINKLVECLLSNKNIGIVGPGILNTDGSIQKTCARRKFTLMAALFCEALQFERLPLIGDCLARVFLYPYEFKTSQNVEAVSGAAFMIRRDVFFAVNGFDTAFFFGGEDLDLCMRVWKSGYLVRYCPSAEVVHFGSGSSSKAQSCTTIRSVLSNQIYFRKTYGAWSALMYRLIAQYIRVPMLVISSLYDLIMRREKDQFMASIQVAFGLIKWSPPKE